MIRGRHHRRRASPQWRSRHEQTRRWLKIAVLLFFGALYAATLRVVAGRVAPETTGTFRPHRPSDGTCSDDRPSRFLEVDNRQ